MTERAEVSRYGDLVAHLRPIQFKGTLETADRETIREAADVLEALARLRELDRTYVLSLEARAEEAEARVSAVLTLPPGVVFASDDKERGMWSEDVIRNILTGNDPVAAPHGFICPCGDIFSTKADYDKRLCREEEDSALQALHAVRVDARRALFDALSPELKRAYEKHGDDPWGRHEFYGILTEEYDELWDAIKADAPMTDVYDEMLQVIAVCFRYFETGDRYRGASGRMKWALAHGFTP